ncbi:MAG: restriction endonuclease subunit S [Mariprofundales bacterium]
MKSKGSVAMEKVSKFLIGPFGSAFTVEHYVKKKSYRYIRGKDVKPLKLKDDDNVYMPKKDYDRLSKYALKENDILVSVVGTIGNAALVTNKDLPAIFSCKSTVLRPNKINPVYLLTYINTKYGHDLLQRKERGVIQKGLNVGDLKSLDVFPASPSFQDSIENIFRDSLLKVEKSKQTYAQAVQILLQEIGLLDFKPSQEAVNIKSFKDSFATTGRLDAEYYQKKYDDIQNVIQSTHNCVSLNDVLLRIDTGEYSPEYFHKSDADNLVFYIRSTNIKNGKVKLDENHFVGKSNFTRIAQEGDIITARVGSVGVFGEIRKEVSGSVYSDNVLNFKLPDSYIPSVYTLLFNSKYYFEFIDRLARGSVQQRLNQETLKELSIPILDYKKQQQIAKLIEESFTLKKQSEHLLEVAKRAVEIAVEESEAIALAYIKKNTQ